jgi:hypothetical protein
LPPDNVSSFCDDKAFFGRGRHEDSDDYVGGRQCEPLTLGPLPAQIAPFATGLLAVIYLLVTAIASLAVKQHRGPSVGALVISMVGIGVFVSGVEFAPGFLHGLRDRFVAEVGYAKMRQFAREISQDGFLLVSDGVLRRPERSGAATPREQARWDDLVSRYRFLGWNKQSGTIVVGEGQVELYWGSALTGHWGFQVSTGAPLEAPEEDRGRVLRVADDIQFVEYYD